MHFYKKSALNMTEILEKNKTTLSTQLLCIII